MKKQSLLVLWLVLVLSPGLATVQDSEHGHSESASRTAATAQERAGLQGNLDDLDLSVYEGKVVVLTSLAGWCVGCFAEVPNFVALANDYAGQDVVVIGVITQSAPEWTETFIERYGVPYPIYLDMSGAAAVERFGAQVVPTAMMVYDRDGSMVESLRGFEAAKLRPILERLL